MLDNVKTLFFDFDGTLHDSLKIYEPAFKEAYAFLVKKGYAKERDWKDDEMGYWLGFSSKEMWKNFMPNLDETIKKEASRRIGKTMLRQIQERKAKLYDGTLETLEYLKAKGYRLVFLSNCGNDYRDLVKEKFGLDKYFDDFLCAEQHNYIPKYEILHEVINAYPKERVMIGDRFQDIEAGKKNAIYTIGCNYGYGSKEELKVADVTIDTITELRQLL